MVGWGLCLDWLRLPRRTHALRLAFHQLAIRNHRHVRLPQGQFLLLQELVGPGTRSAFVSALELGGAYRRNHRGLGALEPRRSRTFPERQESRQPEGPTPDAPGVESKVRTRRDRSARKQEWESGIDRET